MLLVSDEVICAFGRLGTMFGGQKFDYVPDIITCAKGLTSGYSPIGAMIVSERLFEPFKHGSETFAHGYTFGGHPVSAAVALANLDIFEREGLLEHVTANEPVFKATLDRLRDLPIVGDVRGSGYFYGIELVKDKSTKQTFNEEESERLLRGFLSKALYDSRPVLPGGRPWGPGRAARPAADLRPQGVRRDRVDSPFGAHRGVGPPLDHRARAAGQGATVTSDRLKGHTS